MSVAFGFPEPEPVHQRQRVQAFVDGTLEVTLLDNEPASLQAGQFQVRLLRQHGGQVGVVLAPAQLVDSLLVLDAGGGCKRLVFQLRPNQHALSPGNYVLQLVSSGREVLRRSLNVSVPPAA